MVDVAFVIEPSGSIMAIMPGVAANTGSLDHVACYNHTTVRDSVEISYVIDHCKNALSIDHVDLLDELIRKGYEVNVIHMGFVGDDDYREARRVELEL